jgi:hypothetical protein
MIHNNRVSYANAFDFAETNPSFYLNTVRTYRTCSELFTPQDLPGSENNGESLNSGSKYATQQPQSSAALRK